LTFVDHLSEILMCGADHPYISVNRGGAAETLELPLLQDPKNLGLQLQRKVANLVQKQGPAVSSLEPSNVASDRPSEGAPFVTEHLAFKQPCRNCGTIHLHKRTVRSVAAPVNGFCN
jgi:hypothetical protein